MHLGTVMLKILLPYPLISLFSANALHLNTFCSVTIAVASAATRWKKVFVNIDIHPTVCKDANDWERTKPFDQPLGGTHSWNCAKDQYTLSTGTLSWAATVLRKNSYTSSLLCVTQTSPKSRCSRPYGNSINRTLSHITLFSFPDGVRKNFNKPVWCPFDQSLPKGTCSALLHCVTRDL